MAEHLRNQLARASVAIRPSRVLSLAKFLKPFTPFEEASESLLRLLIVRLKPTESSGFHRAVAAALQDPAEPLPEDFAEIAREIDHELALRGLALHEKRLRTAVPNPAGPIVIDGFFTFSPAELAFIENLAAQTSVTVTLPDWPGSSAAHIFLLRAGFTDQRFDRTLRQPTRAVVAALSLDHEVEQIALRILEHHARGREFREMGVILRVRDPYAPALESMFGRLGIPARFHFSRTLSEHPTIQNLSCGAANIGGSGPFRPLFDHWQRDNLTPAAWAERLKALRSLIPLPEIAGQLKHDPLNHQQLQIRTSTASALDAFEAALDTTTEALDGAKIPLAVFWAHAETAFATEKLRIPDRRYNVVNVLDVYEARQWEFPIAFIPGLTERHFKREERFLFDLATTRATEETILSYPRFNAKGDAVFRSVFLEEEGTQPSPARILPRPVPMAAPHLPSDPEDLRTRHATLSPTSIESFLQCPFQFFAGKTLQLRERPPKPRDRLNILLQGSILHQAIAEGNFDGAFEEACRKNNVPRGYRTEAIRLELLRHFEAFQADGQWPLTWPSLTEQPFQIALTPELSIAGRIDRLDTGPDNQAIVIDYKFSPAARIRDRASVQGGLYLSAAERFFGFEPAGMFYCSLREPIAWDGWHAVPGLKLGESRTPAALREFIVEAQHEAIETFESIVSGNKEVRPADRAKCRYCDFKDICRVETMPRAAILTPDS